MKRSLFFFTLSFPFRSSLGFTLSFLFLFTAALFLLPPADVEDGAVLVEAKGETIYEVEKPESIRGIYLTAATVASKRFPQVIDQLIQSGGNAVVIDVEHGGGQLAFTPKNEWLRSVNPGSKTLDNFSEIVNDLHRRGLYVIARQVVFNDPYTAARKWDWRIRYRGGGLYDGRWLDPSKFGVQQMNLLAIQEVAAMGFDEVQFDYIRFPAANHYWLNYHYDEEAFTRPEVILDFLKKARRVADDAGVELSVDVFGATVWGDVDWKIVGQDIPEIAKVVDAIYPMSYPSHYSPGFYGYYDMYYAPYNIVHDTLARFEEASDGHAEIRPWIQGFALRALNFGPEYVAEQIRAAYDSGSTGFTIWNAGNSYTQSWGTLKMLPGGGVYVSEQGT